MKTASVILALVLVNAAVSVRVHSQAQLEIPMVNLAKRTVVFPRAGSHCQQQVNAWRSAWKPFLNKNECKGVFGKVANDIPINPSQYCNHGNGNQRQHYADVITEVRAKICAKHERCCPNNGGGGDGCDPIDPECTA